MRSSAKRLFARATHRWERVKAPVGYALFALAIAYGLGHAPPELWQLQPLWLFPSLGVVMLMFFLQQWQVSVLLRYHGASSDWLYPVLFNARKGLLNTLLPARSGTLLLLHTLKEKYAIQWRDFLFFYLVASVASLWVSVLAGVWLLLPWAYSAVLFLLGLALAYYSARHVRFRYASCLPSLVFIAFSLFLATIAVFYCLLRGLGYALTVGEVAYFAVVLNVLAQIAITPGNIGVREVVMGLVAPFVALPAAVGIVASSLLLALRVGFYGLVWGFLEWLYWRMQTRVQ
jgi:hypothetical protein